MTEIQKREILRKLIHVCFLIIPFSYRYLFLSNKKTFFLVLGPLTLISLIIDIGRLKHPTFRKIFHDLVGILLRNHELNNITGATYMMISSAICIAVFPANIAFISLGFLAIGDSLASIVGIPFGKRKIFETDKSVEGTIACFVGTFIFALIFINPIIAFLGALTASVAEVSKISIDDNIKIPIASGFVMSLANMFF